MANFFTNQFWVNKTFNTYYRVLKPFYHSIIVVVFSITGLIIWYFHIVILSPYEYKCSLAYDAAKKMFYLLCVKFKRCELCRYATNDRQ